MPSSDRKITLSTCVFAPEPETCDAFVRHFETAMAAGFDGFELGITREKHIPALLEAVRRTKAPVAAVHGDVRGDWLASDPAEQRSAAEDSARYLAYFKEFAPCPIVEHYLDRYNDPAKGKNFRSVMELLLEKTEKDGFVFCMENAPYKPEHDERYPAVAEVASFVRSFGKERMFMTFDLNHGNLREDPVAACADCAGLVRHVHISDNHGIREEHLVPGTGIIDFASVMAALRRGGYSGPWNLEFSFGKGVKPSLESYRSVFRYMQSVIEKISTQLI